MAGIWQCEDPMLKIISEARTVLSQLLFKNQIKINCNQQVVLFSAENPNSQSLLLSYWIMQFFILKSNFQEAALTKQQVQKKKRSLPLVILVFEFQYESCNWWLHLQMFVIKCFPRRKYNCSVSCYLTSKDIIWNLVLPDSSVIWNAYYCSPSQEEIILKTSNSVLSRTQQYLIAGVISGKAMHIVKNNLYVYIYAQASFKRVR